MFAKPRPKKSLLPPPSKKRKASSIEEIAFDNDARHEYLTGFHKRKQQRVKHAQEEAAKRARQEKIESRKLAREDRKREVEEHVNMVNKLLRDSGAIDPDEEQSESQEDEEEWGGIPDRPNLEMVDQEEEYIDEDRYTTVTVESVDVSRDGLSKSLIRKDSDGDEGKAEDEGKADEAEEAKAKGAESRPKKTKKKKFRYENKFERQLTERKHKAKTRSRR